jgi:hypothetical protein
MRRVEGSEEFLCCLEFCQVFLEFEKFSWSLRWEHLCFFDLTMPDG